MSNTSIMSIREMIDAAFGESKHNNVHFKLIQTILYILARQLRLLERRVGLVIPLPEPSASSISIREVKLKANVRKRKKVITQSSTGKRITTDKSSSSKSTSGPTHSSTSKSTSGPTQSSTASKSVSGPTQTSTSKSTTQSTLESITEQSLTTKTTTDTSSRKTSSDPTETTTETYTSKTSSDPAKTTTDTTTSKSSSDRTKTTTDTTTIKTSSDRTKTTTDTTTSKSSSDRTKTTTDTTISKISSDPLKTSTSTKSSTEPSSSYQVSTDKSSSSKTKSTTKFSSEEKKKKGVHHILEKLEEEREREIRSIHQFASKTVRADSHEEPVRSPTPMASVDAMEVQYEKLLVVERVPSEEARTRRGRSRDSGQVSVVTQEQFAELAECVREIQNKFGATGRADFPENMQLMQDLRRGASLTDAMAALQLSARLEAAEKTLEQMISLVTDLAAQKGVSLDIAEDLDYEVQEDTSTIRKQQLDGKPSRGGSSKSSKSAKSVKAERSSILAPKSVISSVGFAKSEIISDLSPEGGTLPAADDTVNLEVELKQSRLQNLIKSDDLEEALKQLSDGIMKSVNQVTHKISANAENAYKTASKLEGKLEQALGLGDRMSDLESIVSQYVEQINIMDASLSSQMTNYQEQLTQMQHDLEAGLEAMAEALANTGGDTVAVAELNAHFTDLQVDFDNTNARQRELKDYQDNLSLDLQGLLKQIEILRETKSDRDEVADALRDKAGLGALNGLVTLQQFNAVRGDFEKRIGVAYDKFNNQEIIWQKAIDDLLRELNEKADIVQLVSLRDDVNNNLERLRSRIHAMMEIVGEPRAAAISRQLFRDSNCISCSTPAKMTLEQSTVPILPKAKGKRPPAIGAEEEAMPKESGDYVCYPGKPIPHPIDERAHFCRRYCGGSHTLLPSNNLTRAPTGMIITTVPQNTATAMGTDGKVYKVEDERSTRRPCTPCNQPQYLKLPQPSVADTAPRDESDMMPWDFQEFQHPDESADLTPPPPTDGLD